MIIQQENESNERLMLMKDEKNKEINKSKKGHRESSNKEKPR